MSCGYSYRTQFGTDKLKVLSKTFPLEPRNRVRKFLSKHFLFPWKCSYKAPNSTVFNDKLPWVPKAEFQELESAELSQGEGRGILGEPQQSRVHVLGWVLRRQ